MNPEPDGQAPAIQATALAEGAARARDLDRRQTSRDLVEEALAQKTLAAWISNRHQTLYPLAINLRRFDAAETRLLAATVAVALLAAGEGASAAQTEILRSWLRTVGGDEGFAALVDAAMADPPALSALLAALEQARLGTTAFSMAIAAVDQRLPANRLFLDYLAARLAIPGDVARSLAQRFRS